MKKSINIYLNMPKYILIIALLFIVLNSNAQDVRPYSIIIKGGHVIDPKNNIDEVMDIAIKGTPGGTDGKIARVAKDIDPSQGVQVVNAEGLYVTPGLVDIHVHFFWGTDLDGTYRDGPNGLPADGFTLRTGVTTVVDAGSPGWRNFETYKAQTIDLSKTRVLAMLNIIGEGMAGARFENNNREIDVEKTAEMALKYPAHIVGIKNAHYYEPDYLYPIEQGIEAGRIANIPFMLDGRLEDTIFRMFRPGDIYTHTYGRAILDSAGQVKPFVLEARERGVIFDVGFGGASFDFARGLPAVKSGFYPHSISTDLHTNSMNNAMKDMPNIMGLFMAMGMPFNEVIAASTWNPARIIQREDLGHLSVGAEADIALFRLREGKFGFWARDGKIEGTKRLETEMTIRAGNIAYSLNGLVEPVNLPRPPRN